MASRRDSGRSQSAGKGGSFSAAFAVATVPDGHRQATTQPTMDPAPGSLPSDSHPVSRQPGSAASVACTLITDENAQDDKARTKTTATVMNTPSSGYTIEKLENEVLHFMKLSMTERKQALALTEEVAAATQQKIDVERQVQQLQGELNQARIGAQGAETTIAELQQTIETLKGSIDVLKSTGRTQDADLERLQANVEACNATIRELEERLHAAKADLARKMKEDTDLRQRLDEMEKDFESQRSSNATLQRTLRQTQGQRDKMRDSNTSTKKKLSETVQTANTLSDLVKRKISELEDVKKSAEVMRQDMSATQDELMIAKTLHNSEIEELKAALEKSQREAMIAKQAEGIKMNSLEQGKKALQRELEAERERLAQKIEVVDELTKKVHQHERHRVRTVAICVDLSGSVTSSGLTAGIKSFYAHLLDHLNQATCKTYIMTVVHGPGYAARVKSNFESSWDAHENALNGEQADGSEAYDACLLKVKEATLDNGAFLADLQIVLLGDGNALADQAVDRQSLCQDFSSKTPPVSIHSVVVQRGMGTDKPEHKKTGGFWNYETWRTWDYADRMHGNNIYWGQDGPLPDLSGFLF
ncbi:hypothetical protein VM1G_07554 [Cytospora mali]|uniref:Uncharacterized protein n=1 Tax=Cytospora mali TaxID=578113 RepID=A0A194W7X0_CYTMA|nr:hypothetical protein VM1G_07554 [Valsa mali]